MYPLLLLADSYSVTKALIGGAALVIAAAIGAWRLPREKSGPSNAERLASIETRVGGVETELGKMRSEHRDDMLEIRDWIRAKT